MTIGKDPIPEMAPGEVARQAFTQHPARWNLVEIIDGFEDISAGFADEKRMAHTHSIVGGEKCLTADNTLRRQRKSGMRIAFFALIYSIPVLCQAAAPVKPNMYPAMAAYGNNYENSCSPVSRKQLRTDLFQGKIEGSRQLLKIIETLLCGSPTLGNKRFIASAMASTVSETNEGTGQDPSHNIIKRNEDSAGMLLASGQAWDTTIDFRRGNVNISYRSDEVCMTSRTLRYSNKRWRIFFVGQACD